MEIENVEQNTSKNKSLPKRFVFVALCLLGLSFVINIFIKSPNRDQDVLIHVSKGETLSIITNELFEKKVINSPALIERMVGFINTDKGTDVGDYLFTKDIPSYKVAYMLARSYHNVKPTKVTFPEGATNLEMANVLSSKISNFNKDLFINETLSMQGKLLPDTYFFWQLSTPQEVISALSLAFTKKISPLLPKSYSKYSESEILSMAAIVQKEALGKVDAGNIAGILWKRLEKGMLLQVDAAPITYKVKGLPTVPIANPGVIAVEAAVNPVSSPYLFYLHDKDGKIHYAKTFEEHKLNIKKYLK